MTGKKKRGRPPKPRPEGGVPSAPRKRGVDEHGNPIPRGSNPIDPLTGKKKRGRPKKSDLPPGSAPPAPFIGPKKPRKNSKAALALQQQEEEERRRQQQQEGGGGGSILEAQLSAGTDGQTTQVRNSPDRK